MNFCPPMIMTKANIGEMYALTEGIKAAVLGGNAARVFRFCAISDLWLRRAVVSIRKLLSASAQFTTRFATTDSPCGGLLFVWKRLLSY